MNAWLHESNFVAPSSCRGASSRNLGFTFQMITVFAGEGEPTRHAVTRAYSFGLVVGKYRLVQQKENSAIIQLAETRIGFCISLKKDEPQKC